MAYASKYYDPVKAHEYYMRTRELKGYENRYGGSRGDGTSAASSGYSSKKEPTSTEQHNINVRKQIESTKRSSNNEISEINQQISDLKNELNSMSKEDRIAARENYNSIIRRLRQNIQIIRDAQADQVQTLKEQQKGGSTSGFNQKGREAAEYIKKQMEQERDDITKKINKEIDSKMLSDIQRLKSDIDAMRRNGRGFSRKQLLSRITGFSKKAKREKAKTLSKRKAEYKQKYKDEIDKLRQDKSMYTYYDTRARKMARRAEIEQRRRQREEERSRRYN